MTDSASQGPHRGLRLGQPCRHPSMPEVVLVEIGTELGPSCG